MQDPGEEDLPGWEIRLYRETWEGDWVLVATTLTGPDGAAFFGDLPGDQTWRVWEEQVECWEPTTPVYGPWDGGYYTELYAPSGSYLFFEFGNVYVCDGGEGCTPGYWRNIRKHGDEWVYGPDNYFDDVFGCGPHLALRQTIRARGGGINKLQRFATAALLNAAHPEVDSGLTVEEVIAMTCGAFASENWDIFDDFFDDETCPLN